MLKFNDWSTPDSICFLIQFFFAAMDAFFFGVVVFLSSDALFARTDKWPGWRVCSAKGDTRECGTANLSSSFNH